MANDTLEESLRSYYKATTVPVDEAEKARLLERLSEETSDCVPYLRFAAPPVWRFFIEQLRFIDPRAWLTQVVLLVGMLLLVEAFRGSTSAMLVVMATAVISVAIAVPSVFKSYENDVAELEASCLHDSVQVLICRLALFGLADVLWMSVAACLVPTLVQGDPLSVFLYAATPFFAFCALCLFLSRKMRGRCVKACVAAASCVVVGLWALSSTVPHWYVDVSILVWSAALVLSVALAIHEAKELISQVAADSMMPIPATHPTY